MILINLLIVKDEFMSLSLNELTIKRASLLSEDSYLKFLGGCVAPKNIYNKRGEQVTIPCGKCHVCLRKKQFRGELMCKSIISLFKYVYFYTLTYSEDFVPRCKVEIEPISDFSDLTFDVRYIDKTLRPTCTKTKRNVTIGKKYFKKSVNYGKVIHSFRISKIDGTFEKFNLFKAKARPTTRVSANSDYIRVVDNTDLQKFLKRLRFQISEKYDERIAHYSVSEYGPKTFRPHFHGVICFDSAPLSKDIVELVRKSWKFGDVDCSLSRDASKSANYISGYINSDLYLPLFLKGPIISPKCTHSVNILTPIRREFKEVIYGNPRSAFTNFTLVMPTGNVEYVPTSTVQNILFPRCYNYARQTTDSKKFLYKIYSLLSEKTGLTQVSSLTKYCIVNSLKYDVFRFLRLLDIRTDSKQCSDNFVLAIPPGAFTASPDISSFVYRTLNDREQSFFISLYQRIYSAIYLSKHFITFCCENHNFEYVFNLVLQFHDYLKPQKALTHFYLCQQQYHNLTGSENYGIFFSTGSYYDWDAGFDFPAQSNSLIHSNVYIQSYFDKIKLELKQQVKHKELNELNYKMFN